MIANERELNQSVESLKLLYGALAALRRDILPINPQRFELVSFSQFYEIDPTS